MSSIDKLNEGHFTDLLDLIRNRPLGMKYKIDFHCEPGCYPSHSAQRDEMKLGTHRDRDS